MNVVQRIAKNTVALFTAHFVVTILSLVLSVLIARNLGDVVFGKYSFAVAFTAFFGIFLDLGYSTLLIRNVSRDRSLSRKYLSNIFSIRVLLSSIVFVCIVVTINVMDYPADTKIVVYLFGIYTILESLSSVFRVTFIAFEKMEYDASITILVNMIKTSLGLLVLFLGFSLIELALVFLYSSALNLIVSSSVCEIKFVKTKIAVDFHFLKNTIKSALPIGILPIFGIIYMKADIIMLSMMKGDAVVGWYNAAYSLAVGFKSIPFLATSVLLPVMSNYYVTSKDSLKFTYEKLLKYLLILGVPLSLGVSLLSEEIIILLYGQQYYPSIIALQILAWDALLIFLYWPLGGLLISIDRQNQMAITAGFTALVNVILNMILIPTYSYIGAAIATISCETVLMGSYIYISSKHFYKLPFHKIIIRPIIASLIMGCFIYLFKSINLFLLIILSIGLYFAILISIKGISKEDIHLLKQIHAKKNKKKLE